MTGPTNPFDWSGGHPALDLVNTLDERPSDAPIETLTAYGALVSFTELAGLIEPSAAKRLRSLGGPACTRVIRRARELREHLYTIVGAIHDGLSVPQNDLDAIAVEVRRAHAARALTATGASSAIISGWRLPTSPEIPVHACALAIEDLLLSTDHSRIHKCGAADCEVYFIDTSKAHRRQWCSMKNCGNREKQRRWRSAVE
ncbi:CGNR zinc finger domain-containing protein [Bradyrhizobium sp. 2S1]|uniref:CGNR zinc finger domain-containing protein n=1 Tax=Bradyrhizobium sp. 2S1 TaxID=1404429 RepID=UPI001408BCFB|nr:CGNR zinc finger domain-containing protein [Bradyrhizobium sp. 2S1]MCK7671718.1 CGNR zinc finger domain-containing protein [Bradyrhizobium sp. 2S1]